MKKIIAMLLTVVMLLSMTVFASSNPIFPIVKSGTVTSEVTLECEAPGIVPAIAIITFIDPEYFVNGLSGAKIKCEEKYDINDDYTRITYSAILDMELPINLNANFKLGANAKMGLWFEYDVTDEANPVCRAVLSTPMDTKYIVIDVIEELAFRGHDIDKMTSDFKKYINQENIEKYIQQLNEIMLANATVTEGKNSQTVTISGEQYMNYIKDMLSYAGDIIPELESVADEFGVMTDIEPEFDEGMDMSMVIEMNYDSNGLPVDTDVKFTMTLSDELAQEAGIKSMSVGGTSVYADLNRPVSIEFPELTEENSVKVHNMSGNYDNCYWLRSSCDYIPATGGKFYVSLSDVMGQLRGGHEYSVENRSGNVVIKSLDGSEKFDTVEFAINACEYTVDSEKRTVTNPFVYSEGTLYADVDFVTDIFGFSYESARSELISGTTIVRFERECPATGDEDSFYEEEYYPEEEYHDEEYYEDLYNCEHYQNLWIPVDYPGFDNDYFGLRAIIDNHVYSNGGDYGITYDNGVVTLVNNGEDGYFKTATVTVGSNVVTVDGVEYNTSLPAVIKDGKVYIDKDAIGAIMKYELKCISIVYPSDESASIKSADFERQSPFCNHDAKEIDIFSSFYYDYY